MASVIRLKTAAIATFADNTDMDSLASGAGAYLDETGFDNSAAGTFWPRAWFEIKADFALAPTAGRALLLYILPALDGSTYPDQNVTAVQSCPALEFPVAAATTGQVLVAGPITLPPCPFRGYLVNDTDQALSTDAMHVKIKVETDEIAAS
jgi:hypothetical protein